MQSATVIFVGTPTTSEPTSFTQTGTVAVGPRAGEAVTHTIPALRLRFAVDEWIHGGIESKNVDVSTMADTAACGYPFKVGVSYLVYASESSDGLAVSFCSRTGPVAARADDLALLHETKTGVPQTRLAGSVYKMELRADGSFSRYEPVGGLANIPIIAEGTSRKRDTVTDERGRFVFVGLEPGRYRVTPALATDMEILFGPTGPVMLNDCSAEIEFPVVRMTLSGTVVNTDGSRAGQNVRVDVVKDDPEGNPPSSDRGTWTYTDVNGAWKLQGLPVGRYRIGLNLFGPPTPDSPFAPTWHARATSPVEARLLDLSDDRNQRIEIAAPAAMAARGIEGIVVDASGAPVAEASVLLFDTERPTSHVSHASSGRDGRFNIRALKGRRYQIQATAPFGRFLQSIKQEVPDEGSTESVRLVAIASGDKR